MARSLDQKTLMRQGPPGAPFYLVAVEEGWFKVDNKKTPTSGGKRELF